MRSYQQFFCGSEMSGQQAESTPGKSGTLNVKTFKTVFGLSLVKLCLAVLIVVFLSVVWAEGFSLSFEGFLTALGLLVVLPLSGASGLVATRKQCRCWMTFFLAPCILSALFSFAVLVVYAIELNAAYSDEYYFEQFEGNNNQRRRVLLMYVLLLLCVMADTVIAVVASAFSCHALCQCCEGDADEQNLVHIEKAPIPTLMTTDVFPADCVLAKEAMKVELQGCENVVF